MVDQPTLPFDAPKDDPVSVYFASGLTALSPDQLSIVELISGFLSEFCANADIQVHQPVMTTDPQSHPDLSPEEVRSQDFQRVTNSDALVVLSDFPSWGGGIEVTWAERLRIPMLVLARDGSTVSRLLRGSAADVCIHSWRFHSDIREAWQSFFLPRKSQLETHRRLRANRHLLWGPTLGRLVAAHELLDGSGRAELSAITQLTLTRVAEILSSPVALAEASLDEVQALTGSLGLPSATTLPGQPQVELSVRALNSLQNAAELQGWTGAATMNVLRQAQIEMARGGMRRFVFNEPQDWIDFAADDT